MFDSSWSWGSYLYAFLFVLFALIVRGIVRRITWRARVAIGAMALKDRTSNWPIVKGRIYASDVLTTSEVNEYSALVSYSYSVEGEYWSGELKTRFRMLSAAAAYVSRYPKDGPVPVRYNPQNPGESTILDLDQKSPASSASQ
jgi:hypothetical protein